jgi:excisionase family DNA binding protein
MRTRNRPDVTAIKTEDVNHAPSGMPSNSIRLLKAKEVATILGLGRSKVYEMMERGQLPVVHIGTAVRVPLNALLAWIEEHTEKAA